MKLVIFFVICCMALAITTSGRGVILPLFAYNQQQEEFEEESNEKPKEEKKKPEEKKEVKSEEKKEVKPAEQKESKEETIEQEEASPFEDVPRTEDEMMKFYKEKYEANYEKPFEDVWNAVLKSFEQSSCLVIKKNFSQTDEGLYKGTIHSDFCVFVMGADSTFRILRLYSKKMPQIRGGNWINGRIQYKLVIKEKEAGKVNLVLKAEMSGSEDVVTSLVHFWESNGYLETKMMERIRKNLGN
ncbi:MAG: hypothetical protein HW421_2837 [Ignavibacteria bacterium]|nr:hypothetical protein [Ignavibacteria bacterium]